MITVAPVNDKSEVNKLFEGVGKQADEYAGCVKAGDGADTLGFCLYELYEKGITVVYITPKEDLSLVDGILRATLHVAASRSAMDARYEGADNEILFEKLGFILDKAQKKLDIDKLFRGCGCRK